MHEVGKIRFGIELPQDGVEFEPLKNHALEAERLGYHSVWLVDHLVTPFYPPAAPMPECWTTMSALAVHTNRARLGSMVLCNAFRHPPLLANMAATLDRISNGRLEFAIGTGWVQSEFLTYGFAFPSVAERMDRLEESLQIFKKMWTEARPSFEGEYYSIREVTNCPRPLQQPHPPIWVGGKGEKRLLRLVAKYADKWNAPALLAEEVERKIQVLDQHCADIGRDPREIEKTWWGQAYIDEDAGRLRDRLARRPVELTAGEYTRHVIAGTPDQFIAQLQRYVQAGITQFILFFGRVSDLRSTHLFATSVMPTFR